jgi:hypothetical protein
MKLSVRALEMLPRSSSAIYPVSVIIDIKKHTAGGNAVGVRIVLDWRLTETEESKCQEWHNDKIKPRRKRSVKLQ